PDGLGVRDDGGGRLRDGLGRADGARRDGGLGAAGQRNAGGGGDDASDGGDEGDVADSKHWGGTSGLRAYSKEQSKSSLAPHSGHLMCSSSSSWTAPRSTSTSVGISQPPSEQWAGSSLFGFGNGRTLLTR